MNIKIPIIVVYAVVVIAVVSPGSLFAATCFEDSPSVKKGIDPKTKINIRELSPKEYRDLQKLLNNMAGRWQGTAVEVTCKGSIKSPVQESFTYEVVAKIIKKRPHITLSLESEWYSEKKKSTRLENLRLHLTRDYLRFNSDQQEGDVELIKVSDSFLVFLKKAVIRNPGRGVIAQEVVRTIAFMGDTLMIEYLTYVNGILVVRSEWELNSR